MSNQPPPPFGDHPNFTPQWPPFYGSMIPSGFFPNTNNPPAGQQPPINPGHQFPFSMGGFDEGSQIPGSGGPSVPGSFFPPLPFMPQMNQSQPPPPPFPPFPVPAGFGYPFVPPPGSSNPPPGPVHTNQIPSARNPAQEKATSPSSDLYREEGEVSEAESAPYSPPANDGQDLPTRHQPGFQGDITSRSPSSSRSSSPYNPPLSVSADPNVVDRAIELHKQDSTTPITSDSQSPRSAIQLRVQAQGALLSLAPHNIRYNELVAEGIKPTVLQQLYAEVGLRLPLQAKDSTEAMASTTKPHSVPERKQSATSVDTAAQAEPVAPTKKPLLRDSKVPVSQSEAKPNAAKPMERKEVIARMLAAKAAKASETSKTEPKELQARASESATAIYPSKDPGKENVVPVREKNKAQTELARQRIEELKRQALLRSQQKAQQSDQSVPGFVTGDISSEQSTPTVQHPLPLRPPLPQPSSSDAIPGLSMAGLQQNSEFINFPAVAPGLTIDPEPVHRGSQRKRPLAADFDEPVNLPKRPSTHSIPRAGASEKLIIDISDDESLYGDDEGETMDVDSGHEQDSGLLGAIDSMNVPSQSHLAVNGASTSTPQGVARSSDHDYIRKRDMEIQAMHRRIAELEERRKAKIAASRTGSPHFVDDPSTSSSVVRLSPFQSVAAEASPGPASGSNMAADTSKPMSCLPQRPNLIDSFSDSSVRVLASMDMAQLDSIRSKILRMREIESGLPGLEVEISSSESRFETCKQEAERLLSEITRGKEGRLQLIEELRNLSYEIGGLTLENIDEIHRQAGVRQQHLLAREGITDNNTNNPSEIEDSIMSDAPFSTTEAVADKLSASESERESHASVSAQSAGNLDAVHPYKPSPSESGSSMDESDESSSDDSSDAELSPLPGVSTTWKGPPLADAPAMANGSAPIKGETPSVSRIGQSSSSDHGTPISDSSSSSGSSEEEQEQAVVDSALPPTTLMSDGNLEVPPPGRLPVPATENANSMNLCDNQTRENERVQREPSAESDAYEPPEPGTVTDSFDLAYSPRYSPAPPGPVEDMAISMPPLDKPYPEEPLTPAPQASTPDLRRNTHMTVLGDQAPSTHMEPKFTSYVSPLRHFKAYRYHPSFAEDITGGYRSLTFSHNIDPMKHLCPFELAGGVCNDRSCDFQHFRDMSLSDDKILIQMGAVREGRTDGEKETYIVGLKAMINEMRRDKVKDFSIVASEIAAYRRRFLQDPSRVLPL